MVGSAIWNKLLEQGYTNLYGQTSTELDLINQAKVQNYFRTHSFDIIIDAAARVGGILANNTYPYQFLMDNMQMQNNLISAAHENGVEKFIFLGSSCIYPRLAPQPITESSLLTGPLEQTNEWYALAKIAGVKACEAIQKQYGLNYISLMPTNLYGPRDNFDLKTSHVLPAMIRKFHDAKENNNAAVELWGSGSPMREFLHVDDMAEAVVFSLENNLQSSLYNIGTGKDISIKELANTIQKIVGHKGDIIWDSTKPDGTPRKLLDVSKMANEGWTYNIGLSEGIQSTYQWFLDNHESIREVKIA